jgi:hypothetical protein
MGTNFANQKNSTLMVLEYCSCMGMDKLDGQHVIIDVVCLWLRCNKLQLDITNISIY